MPEDNLIKIYYLKFKNVKPAHQKLAEQGLPPRSLRHSPKPPEGLGLARGYQVTGGCGPGQKVLFSSRLNLEAGEVS